MMDFYSLYKATTFLLLLTPHMKSVHDQYMYRCLQLARLGKGKVAPNPMVGAVLVHEGRIIGEGWHRKWGGAHAEVECVASVADADRPLIADATMYVSLEPCAHWGKTPPCADLILAQQIKNVVVGCRDPFPLVAGKGIEKLHAAGVEVVMGVLERECRELNRRFFTFHTEHRPYVVLKWAQTGDGKISCGDARLKISHAQTDRLVHRWRSEEAAILVGTNTALADDPELSTRLWPGSNAVRLVTDVRGRLPKALKLFDGSITTVVFSTQQHTINQPDDVRQGRGVYYYQVADGLPLVRQLMEALNALGIQSVLVEGGARLLQSFINEGYWDEARVITNEAMAVGQGIDAPVLQQQHLDRIELMAGDSIRYFSCRKPSGISPQT